MSMDEDSPESREPEPIGDEASAPFPGAEVVSEACLVTVSGKAAGRIFPLARREIVMGRAAEADLRIEDRAVSNRHAKIVRAHGEHVLLDLGSMNGTFLNGQRILPHQPFSLAFGDSIQLAETVLAYLPSNAKDARDQTQYLARLAPQLPGSTALRLPDAQVIAALLQRGISPGEEARPVTLEEQIEKLLRAFAILKRNWHVLFAAGALVALAANASVFLRPPTGEASARLRITPSKSEEREWDRDNQGFYTQVEQNFSSPALIERTLAVLGETNPAAKIAESASALKFRSTAFQTYDASFSHADPKFAVRFLDRHLDGFLASEVDRTLHVQESEVNFLASRLKEREEELRRTERELQSFKKQHLEGLPENSQEHIAAREALYARRAEVTARAARANLELAEVKQRLDREDALLGKQVERAAPYEQSLAVARGKLAEARAKGFGDRHAEVIALESQIQTLERLAENARSGELGPVESRASSLALRHRVGDARVASRAASAELAEINRQIARLDAIVGRMPEIEAEYAQLTRSYTVNKENHAQLLEQLKTSQLRLELERTSAKARYEILAPPTSAGVPLRKELVKRTLLGLALGLALGFAIVLVTELRRLLVERRRQSLQQVATASPFSAAPVSSALARD